MNTRWDDYSGSLEFMLQALNILQTDKEGINLPHRLPRKSPNPAAMTTLRNGIEVYSATKSRFSDFKEVVIADYISSSTEPATFEKPIYSELKAFLESELKKQNLTSSASQRATREAAEGR